MQTMTGSRQKIHQQVCPSICHITLIGKITFRYHSKSDPKRHIIAVESTNKASKIAALQKLHSLSRNHSLICSCLHFGDDLSVLANFWLDKLMAFTHTHTHECPGTEGDNRSVLKSPVDIALPHQPSSFGSKFRQHVQLSPQVIHNSARTHTHHVSWVAKSCLLNV